MLDLGLFPCKQGVSMATLRVRLARSKDIQSHRLSSVKRSHGLSYGSSGCFCQTNLVMSLGPGDFRDDNT